MNQLNRFDKYAIYYFAGFSPIVIIFCIWATLTGFMNHPTADNLFWNVFGWMFISWVLILLYTVTKMLFSRKIRDILMAKLAGIKERDEREVIVAGNAAKFAFLSTFALLLFMLVFSVTTFTVKKAPNDQPKRNGTALIGFGFTPIDKEALVHEIKPDGVETFDYKSFPLTKPVMILIMMVWMIGSYHLVARKQLNE
ncbi:MAG: hypothetical protein H7177_08355 [Rhizobacter sp.]|nr:hypothetical protein [Bacteriovorax sp.]